MKKNISKVILIVMLLVLGFAIKASFSLKMDSVDKTKLQSTEADSLNTLG